MQEFDRIYTAYYQVVFRYALSLTRNRDTAEEVTQQAFFQALRRIGSFRGDCALESWLCQIAKNTWLSMERKNRRFVPSPKQEIPAPRQHAEPAGGSGDGRPAVFSAPPAAGAV